MLETNTVHKLTFAPINYFFKQEYSEEYHSKRAQGAKCSIVTKGLTRSKSIQEELLTITP